MLRKPSHPINSDDKFFSHCYRHHLDLHSFPTRRSSDLAFLGQQKKGQDSEAKSNARNMVSQIETCAGDNDGGNTDRVAANLTNTGRDIGTNPGQVTTTAVGNSTYKIDALSKSGTHFYIE